jgi:penicillin-binding protein 1C
LRSLAFIAAAPLSLLALDRAFPFPFEALEREPARVVLARDGSPLRLALPEDGIWRLPLSSLDAVSDELRRALVASEDRHFHRHPGVNPLAVLRASWQALRAGRIVSGASTIPMQVARLVEPRPRSLRSKCIEAFRALQLVWHRGRDAVLLAYLDLAPFGGNIEGVGAAARLWFGTRPDALSLGEAALLVALPRAPRAYDPRRHPEQARRARDRVLDQLAARGMFTTAAVAHARRQPLPRARRPLPFGAPHFADFALAAASGAARIETTLDRELQGVAERLVAGRVSQLRAQQIGNAAAVVIELEGRSLRAMVGSADFHEVGRPGQVNGALALRSPGSTLKPWLYALAIDEGEIVPASFLLDVPHDFAGYVAENYDGEYRGRVTAREALVESLNAPAVALAARVGLPHLLALLQRGGLATLDRGAAHYGLPLVLGAGEVKLVDLTNLYAALADDGLARPLRWRAGDPLGPGVRLVSTEAAALVTDVLRELRRPDLPDSWRLARDVPAVAWKTGTSYGHRDAWAVGFSDRFAVGVWVGNLDGRGRPGISGARHAAPLLFELFRALDGTTAGSKQARASDDARLRIADTELCALSHERPGPFCPARIVAQTLPGRSRLPACREHRRILVDRESGLRLAGGCLARRDHRAAIVAEPPPALAAWWRSQGRSLSAVPSLHPDCRQVLAGGGPRILSPDPRTAYRLRASAPRDYQRLALSARSGAGTRRLFWYQDGRLVGAAAPSESLFVALDRGDHELVVVDDAGRSHSVAYRVE